MSDHSPKSEKGVVILYAVLITTVLALVGVSLSNIIARQILLSVLDRGSHLAYYAAHGGYQCAKNLNLFDADGAAGPGGSIFDRSVGGSISCGGEDVILREGDINQRYFCFNYADNYCVKVIVGREELFGGGGQYDFTYTAFGYNVRCADPTNRKVEQLILEGTSEPADPNPVVCP